MTNDEIRAECLGTTGPEMRVWLPSGDVLALLDEIEAMRQAAQSAAKAVPEGWKLAPVEPYPSQRISGTAEWMRQSAEDDEPDTDKTAAVYKTMLDAAPRPPVGQRAKQDAEDAARYRWLRKTVSGDGVKDFIHVWPMSDEEFDASIDTVIAKEGKA